jgi:hypothetical protein
MLRPILATGIQNELAELNPSKRLPSFFTVKSRFMKHAFNIYPALLVLTPVKMEQAVELGNQFNIEGPPEADQYFSCCPQTYWGNCVFKADHSQFMFGTRTEAKVCPIQPQLGGRSNILEPAKFKGKDYTITYIPVLN